MTRDDESMESIVGVSGSMVDLVKGAREVRRLIREASFDSLASEFSLDLSLHDGVGGHTASHFDSLCAEIEDLKDNCDTMSDTMSSVGGKVKASKSEQQFSKESTPSEFASSPDLKSLHKIIHSAPRNKALWTLTHATGFSDNDSTYSPIHRETSASPIFHDTKESRYKVALSSNASECGEWEWDSEGLCGDASLMSNQDLSQQIHHHDTWLQDDVLELDLEAELLTSTFNRCSRNSNHSSTSELDASYLYNKIRLPPSGRSSAMSISGLHEVGPPMIPTTTTALSRSSSTGSFKEYSSHRKHKQRTLSSDESGIDQGMDKSLTASSDFSSSMISSITTPLSPVHEVRESPKHHGAAPYSTTTMANKTPIPLTSITPKSALDNSRSKEHTRRKISYNHP